MSNEVTDEQHNVKCVIDAEAGNGAHWFLIRGLTVIRAEDCNKRVLPAKLTNEQIDFIGTVHSHRLSTVTLNSKYAILFFRNALVFS